MRKIHLFFLPTTCFELIVGTRLYDSTYDDALAQSQLYFSQELFCNNYRMFFVCAKDREQAMEYLTASVGQPWDEVVSFREIDIDELAAGQKQVSLEDEGETHWCDHECSFGKKEAEELFRISLT